MLKIKTTKQFEKDIKRMIKRGKAISKLEHIVFLLIHKKQLQKKYKDHKLSGDYKGKKDCNIEPDWILIYKTTTTHLYLARTGTHPDLF